MRRGVLIHHGVLLCGLISFFAVVPFLRRQAVLQGLLQAFLTVVLLGVVVATVDKPRLRWIVGILAGTAMCLGWADEFVRFPLPAFVAQQFLNAAALAIAAGAILGDVVRAERVTAEKISGALSVYLLMGFVWAFAFTVLEVLQPGSFHWSGGAAAPHGRDAFGDLFYFSFVTLATLGYGDITPVAEGARSLATLEAVGGQLYLAVLVARLVGLQITHEESREK